MLKRLIDRLEKLEFQVAPRMASKPLVFLNMTLGEGEDVAWARQYGDAPFPDLESATVLCIVWPDPVQYGRILEEEAAILADVERRDAEALAAEALAAENDRVSC